MQSKVCAAEARPGQRFLIVNKLDGERRETEYFASYGPCRYPFNVPAIRKSTKQFREDGSLRYGGKEYHVLTEIHRLTPVIIDS